MLKPVVLFGSLAIIVSGLNLTGFCYSELRWLSDREFVAAAVEHEISWGANAADYASSAEFYAANPECCRVERFPVDLQMPGFFERIFGFHFVLVELFYKAKSRLGREAYYHQNIGVSACGNPSIGPMWGMDENISERPKGLKSWGLEPVGSDHRI